MKLLLIGSVFALTSAAIIPAAAQQNGNDVPDVQGLWNALEPQCIQVDSFTESVLQIDFREQHGRFLRGVISWAHEGEAVMNANGELVTEASETVVGVIQSNGATINLADHNDLGQYTMHLIDENTIEVIYSEPGSAAAVCHYFAARQQ